MKRDDMTSQENEKIYGDNYADFFLEYYGIPSVLDTYSSGTYRIINYFTSVVYIPVSEMNPVELAKKDLTIPALYGLTSERELEASGVTRLRSVPNFDFRGKGVLLGFADSGIDYTNPIFQNADKSSKIVAIWDQSIANELIQEGIPYGTEYTREEINKALQSSNPYQIVPSKDEIGHGTMVAGIAAGNEVPDQGFYGVAPDAEIIAVKLKQAKPYLRKYFQIPENEPCYQENDLLFALQYLLNYSYKVNKPIVICISCDTSRYARDGKDLLSSWISLESSYPGAAVLVPAGNEGNGRRHYYGVINEAPGYDTVELNVGSDSQGFTMELWGTTPNIFTIDIQSPSGEFIPKIVARLNETQEVSFIFERTIINVHYQIVESQTGEQLISLRFTNPAKGIWKFNIYSRGLYPINFHVWLPMRNFIPPDVFFIKSNPNTTLLSLSCANIPITVTAYNVEDNSLYTEAGLGFTRINMTKPDIAAPGENIVCPDKNHGFTKVSGTSAATAHASGVAALLFEWGMVKGHYPNMTTQDIKVFMTRGARRDLNNTTYPNPQWGYGILDIYNVFESLRNSESG